MLNLHNFKNKSSILCRVGGLVGFYINGNIELYATVSFFSFHMSESSVRPGLICFVSLVL